jgi:hypothetical protein
MYFRSLATMSTATLKLSAYSMAVDTIRISSKRRLAI